MSSIGSIVGKALLLASLQMLAGEALAASDDGFAAFWTKFQAAVAKSDQKAVPEMIRYPVFYNDDLQAEDFPVIWKGAFSKSKRACLAKEKPVEETDGEGALTYSAFCGSLIYIFGKDAAGWKLTSFAEND